MTVQFASVGQIDGYWPHVKDFLQNAIDATYNDVTLADLYVACRSGNAFLMIGGSDESLKIAAVWRFEKWNDGMVFRCLALGGVDMNEWLSSAFDSAKMIASTGGAISLVASGRKGWAKAIPDAQETYTTFKMEL